MAQELFTEDKLEYNFYPVTSGSLNFKVRAANDAHIALTTGPTEADPMYEILIGGWGNAKTAIRLNRTKPDKAIAETPDVLNGGEFRGFWIRWTGGNIAMGKEGELSPFIEWQDPEPFGIGHFGICTGWGATGSWIIEDGVEVTTADNLEYQYRPMPTGCLDVEVQSPSNAHIALTSGPHESEPMYEIILGGWDNGASVIRYNREKPDKVRAETPGLLTNDRFKRFLIKWRNGHVTVAHDGGVLLEWTDPAPMAISHYGVRTAWGAQGHWKIKCVDAKTAPSAPPAASAPVMGFVNPDSTPSGGVATWVDAKGGEVPPMAVAGGFDNEQLYVGRASHEGALIPGKVVPSHGVCYIAWGGEEHGKEEYQVLCGCEASWVPSVGEVPEGALPSGETEDGEPLFVGRTQHEGTMTVGKVQGSHNTCYIPYGGLELGFQEYEVLVAK